MGKNFSASSICIHLKKEENSKIAPETIHNYIKYLSNSNLITKVQREDIEGKEILTANEKYYITDHGFNQVYNGRNITNISRTIENIVYIELLRNRYKVFIGKLNNSEVDFIAKKGKQKIYIQVSYFLASD